MRKVLIVSFVWLVVVASPAAAKMPPFETTVEVEGDKALITVVLDGYDPEVAEFNDLVGLYPAAAMDGTPLATIDYTPIPLSWVEPFTYQGSVTIPYSGEWVVVPFPGSPGGPAELYPPAWFSAENVESTGLGTPNPQPLVESPPVAESRPLVESPSLDVAEPGVSVPRLSSDAPQAQRSYPGLLAVVAGVGVLVLASGRILRNRRHPAT